MKTRKQSISSLKKKADKLMQEVLVSKYPSCLVCKGKTFCGHHFVPKSQSNTLRYDFFNLVPLCKKCHARHHLSEDPAIVVAIVEEYGRDWVLDLLSRRKNKQSMTKKYLNSIIDVWEEFK